jgi:hypothetical protein
LKYILENKTQMSYKIEQQSAKTTRAHRLLVAALVLGFSSAAVVHAQGQDVTPPPAPAILTPPEGNSVFLVGRAVGTQGYTCLPTTPGASTASWTVKGARPEATIFLRVFGQDFQMGTHFLSFDTSPNEAAPNPLPFGSVTWQSSLDSSKVWGQVLNSNSIPAGSDPSCPNSGAIACLMLQAIGSEAGPMGGTILSKTTFIQRLNTKGGSAPAEGCSAAADVGNQALVPYSADYYFFRKTE